MNIKDEIISATAMLLSIAKADNIVEDSELKSIKDIISDFFQINSEDDIINYINIASTGNAADFGDMSIKRNGSAGNVSSSTRALVAGGYDLDATANTTSIDYFIMSSSGGGNDFGDLIEASNGFGGVSNDTRGIYGGAYPSY